MADTTNVRESRVAAPSWRRYEGKRVVVHAVDGSYAATRAASERREAEQIASALEELLVPDKDAAEQPVEIFVTDPSAAPNGARASGDGGVHSADTPSGVAGGPVVRVLQPDAPPEPLAATVTRVLVARWFGADAASARVIVDGLAGVVAARTKTGPPIADANAWVREALAEGRPVSILAGEAEGRSDGGRGLAATSFVAFLLELAGPEGLRRFLAEHDPERSDQAAQAAYHRPLGALEEAWLGTLGRKTGVSPYRSFFGHLLPLLRPFWLRELEALGYILFNLSYGLALPLSAKYLVDTVIPSRDYGTLVAFVAILALVYVVNAFVGMRRAYVTSLINQGIVISIQERMFAHVQRLSHDFYGKAKVGDLMARFSSDLMTVGQALMQIGGMAVFFGLSAIAAAITIVILSPLLAAAVLVTVPLFALSYLTLRKRLEGASRERQRRMGEVATATQENVSAHSVVKAFGMEERSLNVYRGRLSQLLLAVLRSIKFAALFETSTVLAITAGQLVVLGFGSYLVMEGQVTIGTLLAFIGLLPTLFQPIASLSGVGQMIQLAAGSFERISELLDEPITISDKPGATELAPLQQEIRLDGVSFGYEPGRPVLHELDMTIPAGKRVAIVGPSGSGKSSVLNLLLRFWDPNEGRVLFDGHDVRDVTLGSLRGQIGLVFQDTFLFDTTVRENIAIGREDASDADVAAAARAARLDSYIESLPAGYDTVLGERGIRMSGGQRQRLAIARALLRDPRVLILDEATSALDARTEKEILDTLVHAAEGRTTITITHRLSMAAVTDLIFVLDQGRLVERGTHAELIRAGGLYQRLYEEQTGYAIPARIGIEVERLRAIPLLAGVEREALAALAARLKVERYGADEVVVRQGDPGEELYFIGHGEVDVVVTGPSGEQRVNTLSDDDYFGEMALLADEARVATVRTTMPTEIYSLHRDDFEELLEGEPGLREAVAQTIQSRRAALEAAASAAGIQTPAIAGAR